ncbi:periplasmic binding protein-like II [Neocallimastix californiae]|uniref:Periplasmic binding protein-like II n=1 Tax=Neocallimastix californiae TaxID=1754190 RepID=A0A1Y2DJL7_9FUNG|nr:periplasmic binding protein-like II [Neocallimastix californiae]|eukprot:ORY59346.1 periplasmic binding protein-like II [Neocallimastix californiae]
MKLENNDTISTIDISLLGFIYISDEFDRLSCIKSKFNEYSKRNNLNITLNTMFYTFRNSTTEGTNISYFLDELSKKKEKNEYDMFLLDTVYTGTYAEHFENLKKRLPSDLIELYMEGIATKTCIFDNKLIAMPLYVDYGGLYYNKILLNKYNMTIPATWDELIDTYKFIYEKETALGETIEKFSGLPDGEAGVAATLEMIHSFRKSVNDGFPGYISDEAVAALEKMKEIKKVISDNENFNRKQEKLWRKIYANHDNYIFFRSWFTDDIILNADQNRKSVHLKFAPLPGNSYGISGSCIGGSNIALSKYISEEKKKAATEIYKFLFSKEFQKYLILNVNKRSAIHSLYRDKEICAHINCTMYSNMQGIVRPVHTTPNYPKFSEKFYEYIKDYIIDENIHLLEKLRRQFSFLPFSYWCCFLIGQFLSICYCLNQIGNIQNYTCILRPFFITIGFTLSYVPFFIKLLGLFPRRNKFVKIINKNHNGSLILFIVSDVILNALCFLLDPIQVHKEFVEEGESFKVCRVNEWNVTHYKSDVVHVSYALYFSLFNIIAYMIVMNVKISNRYIYYGFRAGIIMVFYLSNLAIIIFPKFYSISIQKDNRFEDEIDINQFIEKTKAFDDNFQNELKFITMSDFVLENNKDKNYINYNNKYKQNNRYDSRDDNITNLNKYYYHSNNSHTNNTSSCKTDSTIYSNNTNTIDNINSMVFNNAIYSINRSNNNIYNNNI